MAFNAFDKPQGTRNCVTWKNNMETVLLSFRQWGIITGTISAATFEDEDKPTAIGPKAKEAWEVREVPAFMEVSFLSW